MIKPKHYKVSATDIFKASTDMFKVSEDTIIYRYISLEQLMHLVETNTLYLKKVNTWEDPFEGRGVDLYEKVVEKIENLPKKTLKEPVQKKIDEILTTNFEQKFDKLSSLKNYVYGTSWTMHEENDALWRIYGRKNYGIQIQTKVKKLCSALENIELHDGFVDAHFLIGKVDYRTDQPVLRGIDIVAYYLFKNVAYDHEKEVRGLVCLIPKSNLVIALQQKMGLKGVNVDYPELLAPVGGDFIEAITIDPRADDWYVKTIKKYCEGKEIPTPKRSTLYGKPDSA